MHIITDLEQILLDGYHISAVDAYWEQFDEWGKQGGVSLAPLIQVIITFPEPSLTGSLTDCLPKAWCVSNYKHNTVSSQVSCTGYQGGVYKAVHPSTNFCDQAHALAVQSHGFLSEAYEQFVVKNFDDGGSKATAGVNLLLQRYASWNCERNHMS